MARLMEGDCDLNNTSSWERNSMPQTVPLFGNRILPIQAFLRNIVTRRYPAQAISRREKARAYCTLRGRLVSPMLRQAKQ